MINNILHCTYKKKYVTCYSDQGCQSHASNKKIEPPEEGDPNHLLSAYQVEPCVFETKSNAFRISSDFFWSV